MTERDYDDDLTIGIWGTGGLSHSRFGQRLWGNHPGDWLTPLVRGNASCLSCQQSQHLKRNGGARRPGAAVWITSIAGWKRTTLKMAIHMLARYVAQQMVLVAFIRYQGFFHDQ